MFVVLEIFIFVVGDVGVRSMLFFFESGDSWSKGRVSVEGGGEEGDDFGRDYEMWLLFGVIYLLWFWVMYVDGKIIFFSLRR